MPRCLLSHAERVKLDFVQAQVRPQSVPVSKQSLKCTVRARRARVASKPTAAWPALSQDMSNVTFGQRCLTPGLDGVQMSFGEDEHRESR